MQANAVAVKWGAPPSQVPILKYIVTATAGNENKTAETTELSARVTDLAADTQYTVHVAAVTALGSSPPSAALSPRTLTVDVRARAYSCLPAAWEVTNIPTSGVVACSIDLDLPEDSIVHGTFTG